MVSNVVSVCVLIQIIGVACGDRYETKKGKTKQRKCVHATRRPIQTLSENEWVARKEVDSIHTLTRHVETAHLFIYRIFLRR